MKWRAAFCEFWLLPTLVLSTFGCGRTESDEDAATSASRVVAVTADQNTFICSTRGDALPLGIGSEWLESPDARTLAMTHDGGVDLIALEDGSSVHVPGKAPTLEGARWSDDSESLAFFDRGVPMVARRDGSVGFTVPLADAPSEVGTQAAEWARDGTQVAFATAGLGVLTNADGSSVHVFSKTMINGYGSPWMLAFSRDGRQLAGLEAIDGPVGKRTALMLDTQTFETREVEGISHYAISGWTGDDSAVTLWDVSVALWVVPRDGGEARSFPNWGSRPSPTTAEIALGGPGLHLLDLTDGGDRALLPEDWLVQVVHWSPDGETLGYLTGSSEHAGYVSVADGRRLLDQLGIIGNDDWVVVPDPAHPDWGIRTLKLHKPSSAGATFRLKPLEDFNFYIEWFVTWLSDGQLAFLSHDGVHIAAPDGSSNRVVCPPATQLIAPQGAHF